MPRDYVGEQQLKKHGASVRAAKTKKAIKTINDTSSSLPTKQKGLEK